MDSDFNPRTRMGCDRADRLLSAGEYHFNPRTRMGCDLRSLDLAYDSYTFQSTHPHGVRRLAPIRIISMAHFNPRTAWGATCFCWRRCSIC